MGFFRSFTVFHFKLRILYGRDLKCKLKDLSALQAKVANAVYNG